MPRGLVAPLKRHRGLEVHIKAHQVGPAAQDQDYQPPAKKDKYQILSTTIHQPASSTVWRCAMGGIEVVVQKHDLIEQRQTKTNRSR